MATSSILGGDEAAKRAPGRDSDALGPSDSSDNGSDTLGERSMATTTEEGFPVGATPSERDSDSDSGGTGERSSAIPENVEDGADIGFDRIETIGDGEPGDGNENDAEGQSGREALLEPRRLAGDLEAPDPAR